MITLTLAFIVTTGFAVVNASATELQEDEVSLSQDVLDTSFNNWKSCVKVILPGATSSFNGPCSIACTEQAASKCAVDIAKALYGNDISYIVISTPSPGQCY